MSSFAGRNDQLSNEIKGQGKDARTMSTQKNTLNRRRWLRLTTAIMGVTLLALQAVPALAGSKQSLADLSYRLGKEETGYAYLQSKSTPGSGEQLAFSAPAGNQLNMAGASDLAGDRIGALEDAVDMLRGSQQPSGSVADEPADVAYGDAPENDAELAQSAEPTLVVRDEFTNFGDTSLWTGEINGSEAFISEEDGGWYVMTVQPQTTLPIIATGEMNITDGQIVTDARFGGGGVGEVGLFGRSTIDSGSYYYCGIDIYGGAGCYLFDGGQWYDLFSIAAGEIERYQLDRLALDISGDTLTFIINDQVVGVYSDAAVPGGSWGLVTMCYEGYCTGSFDFVDVYDFGTTTSEVPTTTVIATDFNGEQAESFFTGEGDWGFADINDGWYTVALAPGLYFPNMIAGTDGVNDGTITADIAFDGTGAIGVVSRLSYNDAGAASYYICWVNNSAFANCHVVVDDAWYAIEGSAGVDVTLEEINRLSLGVLGDQIFFAVNGQVVTDVSDATLQSGAMGFFHEAYSDSNDYFSTFVDAVNVETIGGASSGAVISSDLNENDLGLYTDSGAWGFADFVYEGVYTVEINPGWYFANPIADTAFIESGAMTTAVDFGGYGSTGLIARHQSSESGDSFYVCWIDTDAYAGCNVVINGEWVSLGYTDQPLELDEMTELTLALNGPEITFLVDGVVVIEAFDDTLTSGNWGFFNDAYDGGEGSWSDTDLVIIEAYTTI